MHRFAYPTPVLPGHDARELIAVVEGRERQYIESRHRLGIRLERIYAIPAQTGPNSVVTYLETDWDYGTTLRAQAQSELALDREFRDRFWQLSGVELADLARGAAPELVGEWLDPAVTKRRSGLAFSFQLVPGQAGAARQFGEDAFQHRRYENTLSRRALPLTVERMYLDGDAVTLYVEGDDPAGGLAQLAASQSVHDAWFKQRCRELSGGAVDLDGPLPDIATLWDRDLLAVTV